MTQYVVGFLFCPAEKYVALIRKAQPFKQKGKLNGIGGHIENNDASPKDAMVREFKEETGILIDDWEQFAVLIVNVNATVHCFRAVAETVPDEWAISTGSNEPIEIVKISEHREDLLYDLHWLIPMAMSLNKNDWPFYIRERSKV